MNKKYFSELIKFIFNYKFYVYFIFILSIIYSISTLIAPLFVGNIVDNIFSNSTNLAFYSLDILIITYIISYVSNTILVTTLSKLAGLVSKDLRTILFNKLHNIKISYIDSNQYGTIVNNFSLDIDNISNGLIQSFSKITTGFITIVLSIFLMLSINKIITLLLILSAPLMYYISKFITKKTNKFFNSRADITSRLNGYTEEFISGQKTVKDFSYESISKLKFNDINNTLYTVGKKAQFYSSLTNPTTRLVSNISYILTGLCGAILISLKKISIGNVSSFLMFTNIFMRPFNEITSIISEIQSGFASYKKIYTFLNESEELDSKDFIYIKGLNGYIEFNNVCFSYDKNKKFIKNMNLFVNKGENIAIVGKTSSGKTTIVNLLMRFYEIDSGQILIDGININSIPINILRKNIGIVLQDTKLFTGTIKENISYGSENITDEKIVQAAKLAHADSFIQRLPNGYNTIISNENMLSSGEIQLINIARIFLLHPPIVILDEATSNVDLITENLIQQAFLNIAKHSTSFVIAHRLSTIVNADRILYIEDGNIIEHGSHYELLKKRGKYYSLYHSNYNI